MADELEYLREEIKQILSFSYGHSQNTIKMVLGIWAGLSVAFGLAEHYKPESLLILFSCMTIFFISVCVLYFSIRKIRSNAESLLKIAAYIITFHEKKPNNNLCWETAQFETDVMADIADKEDKKDKKSIKLFNENNSETMYKIFMLFSFIGILISPIMFFELNISEITISKICKSERFIGIVYFLYLIISFGLLCHIHLSSEDILERKKKHLKRFFEYLVKKEHYTEDDVKEKFGDDFWQNKEKFENDFWQKMKGILAENKAKTQRSV